MLRSQNQKIYGYLFITLLVTAAIVLAFTTLVLAQSAAEPSLDPTRIIYRVAEQSLSAFLAGAIVGSWVFLKQFKFLDRLDAFESKLELLEENQRKQLRFLKIISSRLKIEPSTLEDDEE